MTTTVAAPRDVPAATSGTPRGADPQRKQAAGGWLFLLPNLVGFLVFTMIPLIGGLGVALTDWNVVSGLGGIEFVGLQNFIDLAASDAFWRSVGRTLVYTGVGVPLTMLGGLLLAMLLNTELFGRGALRIIFFLPHVMNMIAVGFVWLLLLNPDSGLVNIVLRGIGIDQPPAWLISQTWSLPTLILINVWSGVGFHALIYLAALQNSPHELYEAAAIDGAGRFRQFAMITLRSLMPTTTFLFVMSMIGQAQGFGLIAFLTEGGPGESTTTLSYLMYQTGFQYYRFGDAAAMGVVSFLGVLLLTIAFWRFQRGRGLYT